MNIRLTIWTILLTLVVACDSDGVNEKANIFENGNNSDFVKIAVTSNADSVFLSWELIDKGFNFDNYQVSDNKTSKVITVNKSETKCTLTRIPYNEVVSVSISVINNNEVLKTNKVEVKTDGLDKVFAQQIIPDNGSVTGGDGMYSIALPDGRSIFLMGDSYIGAVTNNTRSTADHMYRNTYILYNKGKVSALYGANGEKTSGAVPPGVTDEHQKWYWPGHGFVKGNKLYVFQTLMYQGGEGMWGFKYEKTDILEYELPSLNLVKTSSIPFNGSADIHYGMAAHNNGDYIYIYAQVDIDNGINPVSEVLVARTTINKLYDSWEYYNGTSWSPISGDAVKLEGLASVPVSSQFNVFKLRDKYVLLTQSKKFNSGEIYTFISDNPQGPWRNKKLIFTTSEQKTPKLLTYNAMAHPQFEKDGMIPISYNVNTEDFSQQFSDASVYRPSFFWVDIDKILNSK